MRASVTITLLLLVAVSSPPWFLSANAGGLVAAQGTIGIGAVVAAPLFIIFGKKICDEAIAAAREEGRLSCVEAEEQECDEEVQALLIGLCDVNLALSNDVGTTVPNTGDFALLKAQCAACVQLSSSECGAPDNVLCEIDENSGLCLNIIPHNK